jgi:hypothetical protein
MPGHSARALGEKQGRSPNESEKKEKGEIDEPVVEGLC